MDLYVQDGLLSPLDEDFQTITLSNLLVAVLFAVLIRSNIYSHQGKNLVTKEAAALDHAITV